MTSNRPDTGLSDTTLKKLTDLFASFNELEKVILYGSRAKGNFKIGSDIDLTLIGKNLNLRTLLKIENDLDDLLLPYKIDLSLYAQIENQALLNHIHEVGIILYTRGQAGPFKGPIP